MHNFTLASPPIPNIKFLSFVVSEKCVILKICTFSIKNQDFTRKKMLNAQLHIGIIFRASSKFRLIYCFFLVKYCFFIEKVHILRITHFSETTKDRNLIFGMGGDANVKLCIQHFFSA
jgi:hypothetical protein